MVLLLLVSGITSGYQLFKNNEEIASAQRLSSFLEDGSGGDLNSSRDPRFDIYQNAWDDFLDSPIIGKQYVTSIFNFYPHNIVLEVLMSLGIVGIILFLPIVLSIGASMIKVFKSKNLNALQFLLILIPMLIGGMTSGSIFLSPDLWIVSVFTIIANRS